jgi:polysaccharide pyruvyl transferase WcaK-like protein
VRRTDACRETVPAGTGKAVYLRWKAQKKGKEKHAESLGGRHLPRKGLRGQQGRKKNRILVLSQALSKNLGDQSIYRGLKKIICERGDYKLTPFPIKAIQLHDLRRPMRFVWLVSVARLALLYLPVHYFALVKNVLKSDLVIVGGGQLVLDHTVFSPIQFLLACLMAKLCRKPLFICAIGAGPVKRGISKVLFRMAFLIADEVSVRDKYSLETLVREMKVVRERISLTADPALVLSPARRNIRKGFPWVGISTFAFKTPSHNIKGCAETHSRYVSKIAELVDIIVKESEAGVVLIPTEAPYDIETMDKVMANLERKERARRSYPRSVDELAETISACDIIIGTRMHSMILALLQGIPVIALTWHKKIDSLLISMGFRDLLFDIEQFEPREVANAVDELLDKKKAYEDVISQQLQGIQDLARRNGELAEKLVKGAEEL